MNIGRISDFPKRIYENTFFLKMRSGGMSAVRSRSQTGQQRAKTNNLDMNTCKIAVRTSPYVYAVITSIAKELLNCVRFGIRNSEYIIRIATATAIVERNHRRSHIEKIYFASHKSKSGKPIQNTQKNGKF